MLMTPFVPDGPQEGAKWQGLARLVASGATHHEPRGRPGGGKDTRRALKFGSARSIIFLEV
jgi:hypothetical protein